MFGSLLYFRTNFKLDKQLIDAKLVKGESTLRLENQLYNIVYDVCVDSTGKSVCEFDR